MNKPGVIHVLSAAILQTISVFAEEAKVSPVIRVQLQWAPQAQFAGEIAAQAEGYYAAENLRVTLVPGGPAVDVIAAGSAPEGPEFTLSWVPKALAAVQ